MSYWQSLCTKIRASKPKAVDRVMVQCYDGGAGNLNNVGNWNFTGVTDRHAGLLDYSNDWSVDRNLEQFQKWKDDGVATGGFVWLYNDGYDETWDLNGWASGMNRIYKAVEVSEEDAMVEVFSGTNYTGYSVKLPVGTFTLPDLAVYGLKANDLESVKILKEGASARLYINENNTGASRLCKADTKGLTNIYKNLIKSITVAYEDPVGISKLEEQQKEEDVIVYTLDGKLIGHDKDAIRKVRKGQTILVKKGEKSVKIKAN